jgi:hypothetical protein
MMATTTMARITTNPLFRIVAIFNPILTNSDIMLSEIVFVITVFCVFLIR